MTKIFRIYNGRFTYHCLSLNGKILELNSLDQKHAIFIAVKEFLKLEFNIDISEKIYEKDFINFVISYPHIIKPMIEFIDSIEYINLLKEDFVKNYLNGKQDG